MDFWYDEDPPPPRHYLVGVDLGQSRDPSALIVAERQTGSAYGFVYDVGHVERLPLGTRYPAVVTHTGAVVRSLLALRPKVNVVLVVDRTGVGRAVGDLMTKESVGVDPILVTITSGDTVTRADDGGYGVPKRELASVVQAILQTGRLRIGEGQPFEKELRGELAGFRAKIKLSGHVSFEAGEDWRSADHDDLVLALALCCWAGEEGIGIGEMSAVGGQLRNTLNEWFQQ